MVYNGENQLKTRFYTMTQRLSLKSGNVILARARRFMLCRFLLQTKSVL